MKDWTGNSKSIYTTLGASNHTDKVRETNDYYATEPKAAELLLEVEDFALIFGNVLVENAICLKYLRLTVIMLSQQI